MLKSIEQSVYIFVSKYKRVSRRQNVHISINKHAVAQNHQTSFIFTASAIKKCLKIVFIDLRFGTMSPEFFSCRSRTHSSIDSL